MMSRHSVSYFFDNCHMLDKPKILFMLDYKKIHYCTVILNLPLNKTTKKQRCMKLKSPSFQRCRIIQKERSLILVAKGLQESILYKFTRRKLGRPPRRFFPTNRLSSRGQFFELHQLPTCAVHAPQKVLNMAVYF